MGLYVIVVDLKLAKNGDNSLVTNTMKNSNYKDTLFVDGQLKKLPALTFSIHTNDMSNLEIHDDVVFRLKNNVNNFTVFCAKIDTAATINNYIVSDN